jgi:sec-independent protein translocase protein TatA
MVFYEVAEIFAPMQIMMVLVIALLVFGPKRLPDLGRSLGTALRELNKAKNDMMRSFTLDHEPEHEPYKYDSHNSDSSYSSTYQYNPAPAPTDLTDYTIAGLPPKEAPVVDGTVARTHEGSNGFDPATSADYTIASYSAPKPLDAPTSTDTHTGAPSANAHSDAAHKGEQDV